MSLSDRLTGAMPGSSHSPSRASIPGHLEAARPDAELVACRAHCVRDGVQRISAIGHHPTIGDHPAIEVPGGPEAGCDHAPVAIVIARFAAHGGAADIIRQCEGSLLAAAPGRAVRSDAFLAALGVVDAMHAEARTMNFEGTVNLPTGGRVKTGRFPQALRGAARFGDLAPGSHRLGTKRSIVG